MKETIIITGAAGNLGKTISSSLLNDGYHVHAVLGPNDDPEYLKDTNLRSEKVNLLNADDSRNFIDKITSKKNENVIALICLVGGFSQGTIANTNWENIQKMMNLNFGTMYNVAQPLLSFYKKNKRPLQLILVGSRPALNPNEGKEYLAYALAKSLLFKFADFINVDTNQDNIVVSIIVPSTMDTPGTRAAMPDVDPKLWVPTENVAKTIKQQAKGKWIGEVIDRYLNFGKIRHSITL